MARPNARELVEAVREFLEADVLAATDGRVRYLTRVAARLLVIVEGELAAENADRDAEILRKFDAGDMAELAAEIRAGHLDDRYVEIKATLMDYVRSELEISNPSYLRGGEAP